MEAEMYINFHHFVLETERIKSINCKVTKKIDTADIIYGRNRTFSHELTKLTKPLQIVEEKLI